MSNYATIVSMKIYIIKKNGNGLHFCKALLAATLRTYQRAGCENEQMTLSCPRGTSISIEISQYGRSKGLLFNSISNETKKKNKKRGIRFLY